MTRKQPIFFGSQVAISGNTLVVGAYASDDAGSASGSAYIFQRNHRGVDRWGQVAKLTANDAEAADQFGIAVAIENDKVVVGSHFETSAGAFAGAAYVFARNQGGADNWGQIAKLQAEDATPDDQFGIAVAIANQIIVVGAPGKDDKGNSTGAAYIFGRNEDSTQAWQQLAKLSAADGTAGDRFGESVDIDTDTAVIGARGKLGAGIDSGAVYLFSRNRGGTNNWGQTQRLTTSDAKSGMQFGAAVSINGDSLLVGAPGENSVTIGSGAAYFFRWR